MNYERTREIYEHACLGAERNARHTAGPCWWWIRAAGFTDLECVMGADLTAVVEATGRVLATARACGVPGIFTTIGFDTNLKYESLWLQKASAPAELRIGGKWVEIDPRLERREDETVILKKGASAFFGTNLPSILVSQGVDTVILCGETTSGCIRATAMDLTQSPDPGPLGVLRRPCSRPERGQSDLHTGQVRRRCVRGGHAVLPGKRQGEGRYSDIGGSPATQSAQGRKMGKRRAKGPS